MHVPDDGPGPLRPLEDPLRAAPPQGLWTILHGPVAEALSAHLLCTCREAMPAELAALPPRPAGFPAPLGPGRSLYAWHGGRVWIIQEDRNGEYRALYVYGLR